MSKATINDYVFTEPYKGEKKIEAKINSGFGMIGQKGAIVGLTVLVDAELRDGNRINKGSKVYLREELLYSAKWAKDAFQLKFNGIVSDEVKDFILIEAKDIIMVETA